MNVRRNPPRLRRLLVIALSAIALLAFGGCVYLRLLELKKQLARFDKNFAASTADGVAITCLDPLLKTGDVRWLGVFPEAVIPEPVAPGERRVRKRSGDAEPDEEEHADEIETRETWRVRWVKESPPGPPEDAVHDVELRARFENGRLVFVAIPERYFQFFPKELFVNLLRSTGQARIDRESRSAEVENAPRPDAADIKLPTLDSIGAMLGRPTSRSVEEGRDVLRYRYRPITAEKKAKALEVTFSFDRTTKNLYSLIAQLPTGTIRFRVAKPEAAGAK
jgi:hypothetical protein